MIELHKLEHFLALARAGSFTGAASELRLSQPALSRSIQSLERDLGSTLFERMRGRSHVRLTEAGQTLLPHAEALLSRAKNLAEDFQVAKLSRVRHLIAFGMAPLLAGLVFADRRELLRLHELGDIRVKLESPERLMELLEAGEIAFAVGVVPAGGVSPRIAAELVGKTVPRIFVRSAHPLTGGEAPTLADVSKFMRVSSAKWNENVTLRLQDPSDARSLHASIGIDSFDLLVDIVKNTDAVLFSNFRPLDADLVEIEIAERPKVRSNEIMLFTRVGWQMRPAQHTAIRLVHQRLGMLFDDSGLQASSDESTAFDWN